MTGALPPAHGRATRDERGSAAPAVVVRYWAAARSAAGIESETVAGETLADVLSAVTSLHPQQRFGEVLSMCSVLVGAQPVGARDPATIRMAEGDTVEFLPPFAGG